MNESVCMCVCRWITCYDTWQVQPGCENCSTTVASTGQETQPTSAIQFCRLCGKRESFHFLFSFFCGFCQPLILLNLRALPYWRPSLSIVLAVLSFLLKNRSLASYCQISTDLDKILHALIVLRKTLVGQLRLQSAHGRLQAKPERLCFL